MKNSFEKINKMIDDLTLACAQEGSMPLIEKDLLMEKLRMAYAQVALWKVSEEQIQEPYTEERLTFAKRTFSQVSTSTSTMANKTPVDYDLFSGPEDAQAPSYTRQSPSQPKTERIPGEPNPQEPSAQEPYSEPAQTETLPPMSEMPEPGSETITEQTFVPEPENFQPESEPTLTPPTETVNPEPKPISVEVEQPIIPQSKPSNSENPSSDTTSTEATSAPANAPNPLEEEDDLLQFIPSENTTFPKETITTRSLNDLFNEMHEDHSLGNQFQHTKVGDLTKAISINDKFTYIRQLFNNRGEDFSSAIKKLNQCSKLEEAFDLLEEMKKQYYWDTSSNAYLSLCDLLRRKFS